MAENKGTGNVTTRRGFLVAFGAGAAAVALPAGAVAASVPAGGARPIIEQAREWYRRELEQLAEQLRPRFESGELHAMTEEDLEDEFGAAAPMYEIEAAAREYFRLDDDGTEHLVLAVSPSAPYVDGAAEAVMWDAILMARQRGWYVPLATEQLGRNFAEEQALHAA